MQPIHAPSSSLSHTGLGSPLPAPGRRTDESDGAALGSGTPSPIKSNYNNAVDTHHSDGPSIPQKEKSAVAKKNEAEREAQVTFAKATDPKQGLSEAQASAAFAQYGPNELAEKKTHPFLKFLAYLWGPMPIMIWVAIVIELSKGIAVGEGWEDFSVLMILQFANATVGYIEEQNAGDAIAALKAKLAPQAHVCRGGAWKSMDARLLVPGDLLELKIGDVVPADAVLLDGKPVEVDQAALTGESLPVQKNPWEGVLMGSAIKRGEIKAVVVATGGNTFFGKAAGMISGVVTNGRLQKVLFSITMALLLVSVILCSVIFGKLMLKDEDSRALKDGGPDQSKAVSSLSVVIVILVASIPIAIEVVCTSTLALGSHRLSSKGIIVARLSAIEELAGMTILCSDKTGTLTKNKLELLDPIVIAPGLHPEDVVFYAALASKRAKGNQDAIDFAITDDKSNGNRLTKAVLARGFPLEAWEEEQFEPFNPTDKRTMAIVRCPDTNSLLQIAKGAPQVILRMAYNKEVIAPKITQCVQELGDRGYRALGVAINQAKPGDPEKWEFIGVLAIFDPPRDDTKATIEAAQENGIEVKMVTGDHAAIAKETCRMLGMGTNILNTEVLDASSSSQKAVDQIILAAHGFAEVMPEHKFQIVERIRQQGHVTGMTGDGVNDAPALKRADVGIAVAGATDAARAASDLVLTEEGLGVIIDAIFESRKIFQRMRNYIIYRIACTIQLLCFFFFAALCVDPDAPYFYDHQYPTDTSGTLVASIDLAHATEFTLPVISLVIITILNDGCMITISHDQVEPEKKPQRWAMYEMTIVAIVLGLVACISSLLLLVGCLHSNVLNRDTMFGILFGSAKDYITWYELRTIIYLKVSISDFLTLFSARTRTWFWQRSIGRLLGGAACFAMGCSTLLALIWDSIFGDLPGAYMQGLRRSGGATTNVWVYCILWWLLQDAAKVFTYHVLDTYFSFDDPPPPLPNARAPTGSSNRGRNNKNKNNNGEGAVIVKNPLSGGNNKDANVLPGLPKPAVSSSSSSSSASSSLGLTSSAASVPTNPGGAINIGSGGDEWGAGRKGVSSSIPTTTVTMSSSLLSPREAQAIQAQTMAAHGERSVRALQMARVASLPSSPSVTTSSSSSGPTY